jgi:cytochrome P450 family 4
MLTQSVLIVVLSGERWRVYRKILTPAFHFGILHEFMPIFVKQARTMTRLLADELLATSEHGFDILQYSSLCALDIMCGNLFVQGETNKVDKIKRTHK